MGFFSKIDTVAHDIENDIKKLWGTGPKLATIAGGVLTYAGPVLEDVIDLEGGPEAAAEATTIINKVETNLIVAGKLMTSIGPKPSVVGIISGAQSDLQGLLTLTQIKNPKSVANVTQVIDALGDLAQALTANSTQPSPTQPQQSPAASQGASEQSAT